MRSGRGSQYSHTLDFEYGIAKIRNVSYRVPAHHSDSLTQLPEFADLAKYKVFDNIIAITNDGARGDLEFGRFLESEHRSPNCRWLS